ncbi:MAG TPA: sulfatase, partial [Phycisphaerae bacterium]|nr:sulfatase [Phycisphaerae bacterium]
LTEEVLAEHQKTVGPHCAHEISMYCDDTNPKNPRQLGKIPDMAALRKHFDGYDCGIAYMDTHIGQLLDALEKKGVMDELVIIVTADHGENQGELGIYAEHGTADHITCNIPMIIRWPGSGAQGGTEEKGLHYNLDLGPTMMDMLDGEMGKTWDGQSYAQTLKTGEDTGRDSLVISQCAHVCQRSVRFGSWLYMRTYHDGFHLFDREMLFNLEEDPHEQNNLAKSRPELCHQGAHILMDWHDDMMATQIDYYPTDPMRIVIAEGGPALANGQLAEYCETLEKTDRGWAIEELKKRHPREFI